DYAELSIETPSGVYRLHADYVVAADGARSTLRNLCGLESKGRSFRDRFLIADVRMKADFPSERWFWFDPPFHRNQSVLLHRQPDNVWRIDFQLGWDADPVAEKQPEKVIPRVKALLGEDAEFALEWVSVYTFACLRMDRFRHGRVFFAGDAAHGVSPFGARGANSGVQDAENLAWKLALVLDGKAPESLLDTYCDEREFAADENILNSTRATDFITPKNAVSRRFRDATLRLSKQFEFAQRMVNSGRLSRPSTLIHSTLNTADRDSFSGMMVPGAPADDAPITVRGEPGWFISKLGNCFNGVVFFDPEQNAPDTIADIAALTVHAIPVKPVVVVPASAAAFALDGIEVICDSEGLLAKRFDARAGTFYLIRPDQHVSGRWRSFDAALVREALQRATGKPSIQSTGKRDECQTVN
ncbi:MAG: FAD-dependent monooxygenase, partial [Noviherbaspirillum sp.]